MKKENCNLIFIRDEENKMFQNFSNASSNFKDEKKRFDSFNKFGYEKNNLFSENHINCKNFIFNIINNILLKFFYCFKY